MENEWDMAMPEAEILADLLLEELNVDTVTDEDVLRILIEDEQAVLDLLTNFQFPCNATGMRKVVEFFIEEEIFPRRDWDFTQEKYSEGEVVGVVQGIAKELIGSI